MKKGEFHRDSLRSLQAVDRAVGAIVDRLEEKGVLEKTVFIFTSDNGLLWGEHNLYIRKLFAYEEAVRVPLLMVVPGVEPRTEGQLVAMNLDVGPTLLNLAGIIKESDGLSLVPLLVDQHSPWRTEILFESLAFNTIWAALRTERWKYVEYLNGTKELYDLSNDPYEEQSLHKDRAYGTLIKQFATSVDAFKGTAIRTQDIPPGKISQAYDFQLTGWGGRKPYKWEVVIGTLPEGLALNGATGRISGIPVKVEEQAFRVRLESASIARHTGQPQAFEKDFTLIIE